MARRPNISKPKRILRSVRWNADVYQMLEVKATENGGFSALLNRIAAEWCGLRYHDDPPIPPSAEALAKRVADEVVARLELHNLAPTPLLRGRKTIDSVTLHEDVLLSHTSKNHRDGDGRLWLNCPLDEKDEAKKLGAKWYADKKKWYVPDGVDEAPFARWLPTPGDEQ